MRMIGILGGMGPEATADLYLSIVNMMQQEYGAKYDRDFPPFLFIAYQYREVVEGTEDAGMLVQMLVSGVQKLESSGAEFIAIACNTVQIYLPQMRSAVRIPVLSIPEETASQIDRIGIKKVGLLGTKLTVEGNLFDAVLREKQIILIKPNEEQISTITRVIMNVLAGKKSTQDTLDLLDIATSLQGQGAEAIILGCTELPLVLNQQDLTLQLFDTTKILARAAIRDALR